MLTLPWGCFVKPKVISSPSLHIKHQKRHVESEANPTSLQRIHNNTRITTHPLDFLFYSRPLHTIVLAWLLQSSEKSVTFTSVICTTISSFVHQHNRNIQLQHRKTSPPAVFYFAHIISTLAQAIAPTTFRWKSTQSQRWAKPAPSLKHRDRHHRSRESLLNRKKATRSYT